MVSIIRAAEYLDVKPKTIRHLIDTGKLKATKLGRELRISVASLRKLAGD
jgi:excisionase family DNA binding protein